MDWDLDPEGTYQLAVPEAIETWDEIRPYLSAGWAKLLTDLPALGPPPDQPVQLFLCIDGRSGSGDLWIVLTGGGTLEAAAHNPALATSIHLDIPGVEGLIGEADDWEGANCRFAAEVLSSISLTPAREAAEAALALYPHALVGHEGVDPEHGWYVPFQQPLAALLLGQLPELCWTYDFDEES
jgi:hypothetical protein